MFSLSHEQELMSKIIDINYDIFLNNFSFFRLFHISLFLIFFPFHFFVCILYLFKKLDLNKVQGKLSRKITDEGRDK